MDVQIHDFTNPTDRYLVEIEAHLHMHRSRTLTNLAPQVLHQHEPCPPSATKQIILGRNRHFSTVDTGLSRLRSGLCEGRRDDCCCWKCWAGEFRLDWLGAARLKRWWAKSGSGWVKWVSVADGGSGWKAGKVGEDGDVGDCENREFRREGEDDGLG
jgi:hypothetical protein